MTAGKYLRATFLSVATCFATHANAQNYDCEVQDEVVQRGDISFYGHNDGFDHNDTTANGEQFHPEGATVASVDFPFDTLLHITNRENGETAIARVNDTGAFKSKYNRVADVSYGIAKELDMVREGEVAATIRICEEISPYAVDESPRPRARPTRNELFAFNGPFPEPK